MRAKTLKRLHGFTLVELLVASTVALLILLILGGVTNSALKINARENQNVPQQQQLRASIEAISQELRRSIGPRVVYTGLNGTGVALPAGLPVSGATSVTLLVPPINLNSISSNTTANSTFLVSPPPGYPATPSLPARTATTIDNPSLTDDTNASNAPKQCSAAFQGGDYAVLYSTQTTTYQAGNGRNPDAFRLLKMTTGLPSPCIGGTAPTVSLDHTPTPMPLLTWNPNTYIVKVTPTTYSVVNGALMRQVAGQAAQVVAYNVSSLSFSYLPENITTGLANCSAPTFYAVPGCTPRQIAVTLVGTPQQGGTSGVADLTATQTVFLR